MINSNLGFEYVENSNGSYRKWNNGFLECWGSCTVPTDGCAQNVRLPHKFISGGFSVLASSQYATALSSTTMSFCNQNLGDFASFHLYGRTSTGTYPNLNVKVKYYAYGRWK